MFGRVALALAVLGLAAAPARTQAAETSKARRTVTVFAAASLTAAFTELGDSLRRRDAIAVEFNFAGSQVLALQITQGAPADVFASADERWMTVMRDSGFVAAGATTFAHNRLVVIVPASNPAHIATLQDLARPGVNLVLAAEAVPAGRYARTVLARLAGSPGYAPDYSQRVLANLVSNEENVKAVVTKVQLGEADAGIVYSSDVTPSVSRQVRRFDVPESANVIADYPIAALRKAPHPDAARAFVALVLSPLGQQVLARNGFLPVKAGP